MPLTENKPDWLPDFVADELEEAVDTAVALYFLDKPGLNITADDLTKTSNDAISRVYAVIDATCVTNENRMITNG